MMTSEASNDVKVTRPFYSQVISSVPLLHVTDKWLRAIDEGKYTGAVFLDLMFSFGYY